MNRRNKSKIFLTQGLLTLSMFVLPVMGLGQYYSVGDTLSQQTRSRAISYCANNSGTETLGGLLAPDAGESARAVWLVFFASW